MQFGMAIYKGMLLPPPLIWIDEKYICMQQSLLPFVYINFVLRSVCYIVDKEERHSEFHNQSLGMSLMIHNESDGFIICKVVMFRGSHVHNCFLHVPMWVTPNV